MTPVIPEALFICDGAVPPPAWVAHPWRKRVVLNHLGTTPPLTLRIASPPASLVDTLRGRALDLFRIAAYVYAADQMMSRGSPADVYGERWQRRMALAVPVSDLDFWNERRVVAHLAEMLNFISDDTWEFAFSPAPAMVEQPPLFDLAELADTPDEVILFSGGADSLCTAVEETLQRGRRPLLVSHQPFSVVQRRQAVLAEALRREVRGPLPHTSVTVNRRGEDAADTSQRTRAFLFATLGLVMAQGIGVREALLSDNGVVSINLPFTRGQFGAQATRSTHPRFLAEFNELARMLFGATAPRVVNSLWSRTRPEVLRILCDTSARELLPLTASCAHPRGRSAEKRHCGVCSQCIDRRFGTIAAGLEAYDPPSGYEIDIFRDNIPPGATRKLALGYYNLALRLARTDDDIEFLSQFQRVWECIPYTEGSPDQAARILIRLLKRHGETVVKVMEDQCATAGRLVARRLLPPYSLPALIRGVGAGVSVPAGKARAAFVREGDVYALTFDGRTARVRALDGLAYIRALIASPGEDIPAEALHQRFGRRTAEVSPALPNVVAAALKAELRPASPAEELPALDHEAVKQYRSRLLEISAEKEAARATDDDARLDKLEEEADWIERELRRAVARGGRSRADADPVKKQRQAVQKAIKLALLGIERQHEPLYHFLKNHITTGNFCRYQPDDAVVWEV
jgi:7-cyano-7-deazaguanine synthase in queuosine biosynthesis